MRFYLTTAIDYVNSRPHLGTAYEKVTADVIARYQRARGRDVLFLMGNDEHSQNVERAAREKGLDPLAYCDQMEAVFREAWAALDCSFDVFIRTTEKRHHRSRSGDRQAASASVATCSRASTRAGTARAARRSSARRSCRTAAAPST